MVLGPGDILYVPPEVWHAVSACLAVARVTNSRHHRRAIT
ncbi:JmjC domain-containing protein [Streptomyces sp. NPDC002306]